MLLLEQSANTARARAMALMFAQSLRAQRAKLEWWSNTGQRNGGGFCLFVVSLAEAVAPFCA
jgi:hypothetical protein